jgi:hypothetical protein
LPIPIKTGIYAGPTPDKGYPIGDVADFWRRMGREVPGSIASRWVSTHPGTAERYLALEMTEQEIKQKMANGLPIRPERKN